MPWAVIVLRSTYCRHLSSMSRRGPTSRSCSCPTPSWSLTRWISLLIRNLARADDEVDRARTRESALQAGEVYAVQGWVPARDIDRLVEFAGEEGLAMPIAEVLTATNLIIAPTPLAATWPARAGRKVCTGVGIGRL